MRPGHRTLRIGIAVPLGRDEIDLAVERELALLAQPGRDLGEVVDAGSDGGGQPIPVLDQQAPDIVPVGRLDAEHPQHALQRQLDDLLGLADDIGMSFGVEQNRQDLQARASLLQVALGERPIGHISNTSPGL
jgi:hypothetical protein